MPDLLLDFHGGSTASSEQGQREALRLMVRATYFCTYTLKYLHHADLAMIAADLCHASARRLDEPAWTGLADFARLQSLPVENKTITRRLAVEAADRLTPHLDDPDAMQAYGMLQLSAALTSAVCQRDDDARTRLAEARFGGGAHRRGRLRADAFRADERRLLAHGHRCRDGRRRTRAEIAERIRPDVIDSRTRQTA